MANTCTVGITVTTFNEKCGERLHDILTGSKILADKKQEGIFIGCPSRYLFDAKFFRDRDTVQIFGWVKWGFSGCTAEHKPESYPPRGDTGFGCFRFIV